MVGEILIGHREKKLQVEVWLTQRAVERKLSFAGQVYTKEQRETDKDGCYGAMQCVNKPERPRREWLDDV